MAAERRGPPRRRAPRLDAVEGPRRRRWARFRAQGREQGGRALAAGDAGGGSGDQARGWSQGPEGHGEADAPGPERRALPRRRGCVRQQEARGAGEGVRQGGGRHRRPGRLRPDHADGSGGGVQRGSRDGHPVPRRRLGHRPRARSGRGGGGGAPGQEPIPPQASRRRDRGADPGAGPLRRASREAHHRLHVVLRGDNLRLEANGRHRRDCPPRAAAHRTGECLRLPRRRRRRGLHRGRARVAQGRVAPRRARRDPADGGAHRRRRQRRSRRLHQRQRQRVRRGAGERGGGEGDRAPAEAAGHRRPGHDRLYRHARPVAQEGGGDGVSGGGAKRSRAAHLPPDLAPRGHGGGARAATGEQLRQARHRGHKGHADRPRPASGRAEARAGAEAAAVGGSRDWQGQR